MHLHTSWTALFNSLTTVNESGNRNIAGFTGAMDFEANSNGKMTQLNQPFNVILVANSTRGITVLHNPHNSSGTLLRPTNKVGCLVGTGPVSIPVIVNHGAALLSIQEIVPTIEDINACLTVDDLSALPTDNAASVINLEALNSFFLAPFLRNAILAADSLSPLALILVGRAAREELMNTHNEDEDFGEQDVNAHLEIFSLWCLGIHQGKVAETRFFVAPDDGELNNWYACLHRANIMPSIKAAASLPASTTNTADILWSLAAGITCTSEEAEHQNKIHHEQLDYIKEKDAKKNNKAEKWHPTSRCLMLNAASTDSNSPAEEIPQSYLRIINSDTAGMADRELQTQMSELGHSDTGFAHGLAASLYMGDIMWNNQSSPSNLSLFIIFKLDPLLSMQTARCLHLHHLSKNTKGKLMDEIKASQIQEVKSLQLLKCYINPSYFIRASLSFYLAQAALSSPGSTLLPTQLRRRR